MDKAIIEAIFLGLRMMEGIDLKAFKERFGTGLEEAFPEAVRELRLEYFLAYDSEHLKLTKKGMLFSNDVALRFI